ncbi:MAG: asparagine synthetase B family protein, partial [bacterium]
MLQQTTALICGFWNVDGRPASEGLLEAMAEQTFLLPGAEQEALLSGPVGLVTARRLRGAPARPTSAPQRAPENSARRLLAFAGRLDNRAKLASQGLTGSDREMILGAYERWGTGAVERIEGDFVFALWDPAERRLVCARDAVGVRTLYFRFDGRTFSFGSQLRHLTPRAQSLPSFDENYFAHFLLEGDPHLTLTPFQGIEKLPAGHLLVVDEGGLRRERWWRPEEQEKIHYADDSEYAEHFLELFRSSVAARLEAEGPVWSELSGGLDSSSIVCMAREIYRSGGVEQPDFTTLTAIFEDPRSGDAPEYYRSVIERCGFKSETSVADARDLFE